jgi:hypothetical protein
LRLGTGQEQQGRDDSDHLDTDAHRVLDSEKGRTGSGKCQPSRPGSILRESALNVKRGEIDNGSPEEGR